MGVPPVIKTDTYFESGYKFVAHVKHKREIFIQL